MHNTVPDKLADPNQADSDHFNSRKDDFFIQGQDVTKPDQRNN